LFYALLTAVLFGGLFATSVSNVNSVLAWQAALLALIVTCLAIYLPRRFFSYTLNEPAPAILTKLMQRAVIGTLFTLALGIVVCVLGGAWNNPVLLGELYVYTLLSIFLFQGIGEVITNHVIYLQRTNQYNSNQLFGMLLGLALLFFILILFFLAFDLAQAPDLHRYVRDILAITLVLVGYGRAVYLMAHH
jgi:hypothetical protein